MGTSNVNVIARILKEALMDCKESMTNEMTRKEQIEYYKNRVYCTKNQIEYWKTSKSELADELLVRATLDLKAFELYLKKLRKGDVK